ncbi:hypothetical protein [Catenuloplanes japonicus]|uniref:hypothetical protein n=1 Tax=Catenuloplanes japonicus TaxID=33876 RepID=UPI00052465C8|nr:hypothetical protein [Catenuloplanes japonicus]
MLTTVLAVAGVIVFVGAALAVWTFGMWDYVTGRAARQHQATEMLMRGAEAWAMPKDRHTTSEPGRDAASASGRDATSAG